MGEFLPSTNLASVIDGRAKIATSDSWKRRTAARSAPADTMGVAVGPDSAPRRRFLPSSAVTLALLDLLFMASFMAGLIYAIRDRLGFDTLAGTASAVRLHGIIGSMALAYATGCYRHDSLVDFSVSTTRLAVGLGVCVLFLVPLIHFGTGLDIPLLAFRSISRSLTIVLIGVGAGMCGGMLSRIVFMAMARRQWFRRTILVIGTGRRARHLRDILEHADHQLTQVYFLTEAYLGGESPAELPGKPVNALPVRAGRGTNWRRAFTSIKSSSPSTIPATCISIICCPGRRTAFPFSTSTPSSNGKPGASICMDRGGLAALFARFSFRPSRPGAEARDGHRHQRLPASDHPARDADRCRGHHGR